MPVTLLLGDCLDRMREIPDGSVDMVLADLPYGTTAAPWDSVVPLAPLWEQYRRVCKPGSAVVLTASHPFTAALVMSNPGAFRYSWVWVKNKASGHLGARKRPMRAHEDVLVFSVGSAPYFPQMTDGHAPANRATTKAKSALYGRHGGVTTGGQTTRFPKTLLPFDVVNNDGTNGGRFHPTQKPVELMAYLIRTYTEAGATVLDNTMGSGSTGVAAVSECRGFIGVEQDPAFFDIAQRRITAANWLGD